MMKTAIAILLLLIFVFSSSNSVAAHDYAVLDINGDELRMGQDYYIVSAWGSGGGVNLFKERNQTCPDQVVGEKCDYLPGTPVTFSNPNTDSTDDHPVYTSTEINIKFNDVELPTLCSDRSMVWKVGDYDESTGQWFVTTGGVEGDSQAWYGKFQIQPAGRNSYKLASCPPIDDRHPHIVSCSSVRRLSTGYYQPYRLVLISDQHWPAKRKGEEWSVKFIKASDIDNIKQVVDV
ncbi:hypothetical protein PTKIN_Ptkin02bG0217300 [Pterospermum kingtungense]